MKKKDRKTLRIIYQSDDFYQGLLELSNTASIH